MRPPRQSAILTSSLYCRLGAGIGTTAALAIPIPSTLDSQFQDRPFRASNPRNSSIASISRRSERFSQFFGAEASNLVRHRIYASHEEVVLSKSPIVEHSGAAIRRCLSSAGTVLAAPYSADQPCFSVWPSHRDVPTVLSLTVFRFAFLGQNIRRGLFQPVNLNHQIVRR